MIQSLLPGSFLGLSSGLPVQSDNLNAATEPMPRFLRARSSRLNGEVELVGSSSLSGKARAPGSESAGSRAMRELTFGTVHFPLFTSASEQIGS